MHINPFRVSLIMKQLSSKRATLDGTATIVTTHLQNLARACTNSYKKFTFAGGIPAIGYSLICKEAIET